MIVTAPHVRKMIWRLRIACPILAMASLALAVIAYLLHLYFFACVDAFSCGVNVLNTSFHWSFYDLKPEETYHAR